MESLQITSGNDDDTTAVLTVDEIDPCGSQDSIDDAAESIPEDSGPELSSEQMDELLHNSFLCCVKTMLSTANLTELLPLSASTLYAAYILPCRPHGTHLDIKKTSHKKVRYNLDMKLMVSWQST
jgi:hypothetical protein